MQESQSTGGTGVSAGDGSRSEIPLRPVDRSHLLRRCTSFPFPVPLQNGLVRIRRERRVFGSFRGIPSLARDDRETPFP